MSEEASKNDKKVTFEEINQTMKRASISDIAETVEDPFCDEKNPRIISFQDVCQAAFMIRGGVEVTPCSVRMSPKGIT
jgi:hypothetical protein